MLSSSPAPTRVTVRTRSLAPWKETTHVGLHEWLKKEASGYRPLPSAWPATSVTPCRFMCTLAMSSASSRSSMRASGAT